MAVSETVLNEKIGELVGACNRATESVVTQVPTLAFAQRYVLQWGQFTRHSRQCWANVVGNCPIVAVRRAVVRENLYEEEALPEEAHSHYEILVRLGLALGLDRAAIDHATPLPTTVTAMLAWETLTKNRRWEEGLAAKAALERHGFPDLRRRRLALWKQHLGLADTALEFFSMHITADEFHGDLATRILAQYLEPGDLPRVLQAVAQSLQAYQIFYWGLGDPQYEALMAGPEYRT